MKDFEKGLLILCLGFALGFGAGCAYIEKYLDEATHGCMYEKDGKKKGPLPVKLKPGVPLSWEEDGWKVTCEPFED